MGGKKVIPDRYLKKNYASKTLSMSEMWPDD